MQISDAAGGVPEAGAEPCRFPKLEECAHFHYERVQLPPLVVTLQTNMDQSLHSQHTDNSDEEYYMVQVTSGEECWLLQRNIENFKLLDAQLHQCIYDRKISQLPDLSTEPGYETMDVEMTLKMYLEKLCSIVNNSLNCGPVLNWLQMDNKGHRLLVPSEESRSINTPAVAAAYSIRRYVSQARDELNLEVGDMISVIDMASPGESIWWRGKRGFQVGFFPQHCVHIIGDKVPRNMPLPPPVVGSLALSPIKPVLRKHGKLIAFFRSFILNRPSRRRLKQSGILKERVFGCDLGEHLLNSGHDVPTVLECCAEFIEKNGIVDGIYRLSGVTSNIQKLRNAFDEDRIPNLYTEEILQDIHSVASLLKMYFRELPNPLCTYQLYQSFVNAVQGCNPATRNSDSDRERLLKMREAVQKLPPPHYRTLAYLMRHLAKVAKHGASTGMTTRNVAIVWAPNLLRSEELEGGGVAALQGVGVQAVVTEFLICYTDLIFCDHLPLLETPPQANCDSEVLPSPKRSRPKSLGISTPTKLITLEEARSKHHIAKGDEYGYIEVGGGPKNLPKKYHTVLELPSGRKRHSSGWRSFFSKNRNSPQTALSKTRKASTPGIIIAEKCITESNLAEMKRKLRTVKSAESLTSALSEAPNNEIDVLGPLQTLHKPPGHNRSVSHDSYFDTLQNSQNNSEGSLLDLSEIQLNFDLEESEMRMFSEDESSVSSPRIQKDGYRRYLTRTRPDDYVAIVDSNNPSPKKQARVAVTSPEAMSRKRTRLEDQLSDIQYIDCGTPDNPATISSTAVTTTTTTTAVVHRLADSGASPSETIDFYRPKSKSPRNSQRINLEKENIPKSLTLTNITPQSPVYTPLNESSAASTPGDFSDTPTETYFRTRHRIQDKESSIYENLPHVKTPPTYENVLTTISITYKSPTKRFSNSSSISNTESIYEDVTRSIERRTRVPTEPAGLPTRGANQPELNSNDRRPKSLSALEELRNKDGSRAMKSNLSTSAVCNSKSEARTISTAKSSETTLDSSASSDFVNTSNASSPSAPAPYHFIENNVNEGISPSDLSLSEINAQTCSEDNLSADQYSCPLTPAQNSLSPNVSATFGSHEEEEEVLAGPNTSESTSSMTDDKISCSPEIPKNDSENNRIDKRKSSETVDDDNSIYQQVKYLRRSVHEINALLHDPVKQEFDSLEDDGHHIYENVNQADGKNQTESEDEDACENVDVKSLKNMFENKPAGITGGENTLRKSPERQKQNGSFTEKICNLVEEKSRQTDRKESLPPCVRLRNLKHAVKTRSLDEHEFHRDCCETETTGFVRRTSASRRKSLDENLAGRYAVSNDPKTLNPPKELPKEQEGEGQNRYVHSPLSRSGEICVGTIGSTDERQLLNRERIEKYKEERRKELHEKFRTESFKEDKDVLLSRLKLKPREDEITRKSNRTTESTTSRRRTAQRTRKSDSLEESEEGDRASDELSCDSLEIEIRAKPPEKRKEYHRPESVNLKSIAAKFEPPQTQKNESTTIEGGVGKKTIDVGRIKTTNAARNKIFFGLAEDLAGDLMLKETLLVDEILRSRANKDDVSAGKSARRRRTSGNESRDPIGGNDADRNRRITSEPKSPRKEKTSPSLCIKDMKAIFEPKSQQ